MSGEFKWVCSFVSITTILVSKDGNLLKVFIKKGWFPVYLTMLPVCSATPTCSSQISIYGRLRPFCISSKGFEVRCIMEDRIMLGSSNGIHLQGISFKAETAKSFHSSFVESIAQSRSMDGVNLHYCRNSLDDLDYKLSHRWGSSMGTMDNTYAIGRGDLKYVESSIVSAAEEKFADFTDKLTENTNAVSEPIPPQTISTMDVISDDHSSLSGVVDLDTDSLSSLKTTIENFFVGISESINASVNKGENAVKSSFDTISSSIKSAIKGATEAIDNTTSEVFSTVDQTGKLAGNRLENLSNDLKKATSKAGVIAIDQLRHTIVVVEQSLSSGANFIVYSYASAKELLPPEIQNVLNTSEEKTTEFLRPVGTALIQIYLAVEGFERSVGLDPSDPIVPFVLFLGTSATLWVFYWRLTYGGYSGDLSPKLTLELLKGKENAVLIDVRPEDLRERDGIPDLRRAARFRYASVTLPELDGYVRKVLKSGRDLDDTLLAAVIRNLKIVQDRSKVIVLDAEGTRSKGIARSLRKLGVKRPYLVLGGFQSWVKEGLRIKELKPETTLTILNQEAEAILEDVSTTPVQVLGYGVGFIAAVYALLEWERTLQFIGIVGLGQSVYRRVASYEDSEDFKEDVRLLLTPVQLGTQAFSWAAGKLETNGIGLPTSPSSSDVQIRVLQAAAKHESQPSDVEEIQDLSTESTTPVGENVDLSEA